MHANQRKINLCVKLIFLGRKIDISFNIRVHSDLFFILVTYLIWQMGKRQSIKKAIFLLPWGVLSFDV